MKTINSNRVRNNNMISGAMFDFLGFLTTGEDISVGETKDPSPILEKFKKWASIRGLNIRNADVCDWSDKI